MSLSWRSALGILGAVSTLYVAACADSLHLDPATTTGSTSAGAGGGSSGAGGSGSGCTSNAECAFPKAVCDTTTNSCVECLVATDCAGIAASACSLGSCVCVVPTEKICFVSSTQPRECLDTQTSNAACGECGHACFGSCATGKCTDPWEPLPTVDEPEPRSLHSAVWTGSQMIVWGGKSTSGPIATGGIYDPAKRTWTATNKTGAPSARFQHTAVWDSKAKRMIVFGGEDTTGALDSGGAFDPAKNVWTKLPTVGAPSPRTRHTAVFSGTQTIVWGGTSDGTTGLGDGARYDAGTNKWIAVATAPGGVVARFDHAAAFGNGMMFVWGGISRGTATLATGGVYTASSDTWGLTASPPATPVPGARSKETAVATSSGEFVIFEGEAAPNSFYSDSWPYIRSTDSWGPPPGSPLPGSGLGARAEHTAVMVGSGTTEAMIVWGGAGNGTIFSDGASWNVSKNAWTFIPSGAPGPSPEARHQHTAVSDGTKMYIFGGLDQIGQTLGDGAVYDSAFVP